MRDPTALQLSVYYMVAAGKTIGQIAAELGHDEAHITEQLSRAKNKARLGWWTPEKPLPEAASAPEPKAVQAQRVIPTCRAQGCTRPIKADYLMCLEHWQMVPPYIRAKVLRFACRGQRPGQAPSPEYVAAAREAIGAVLQFEQKHRETT